MTAAPLPERGYGLPHDVSVDGFRVDELIHFTLAAITVIFVVVAAALIWSFVKHRSGPAVYSHGTRGSIGLVVGAVALVLFGADGDLFVHTLGDMHEFFWNFKRAEAADGGFRYVIIAHPWAWGAP